jgi:hypothetical protein
MKPLPIEINRCGRRYDMWAPILVSGAAGALFEEVRCHVNIRHYFAFAEIHCLPAPLWKTPLNE